MSATNSSPPGLAEAIEKIASLAVDGTAIQLCTVPVEGLGDGLPASVPMLITKGRGGPASAIAITEIIERYRLAPARRAGTARAGTLASFIDLVKRHQSPNSAVFATTIWPTPALTAVIDYHGIDGAPDWLKHRIRYEFPVTEELKAWMSSDGQTMEQIEFAQFLEEHAAELASPLDTERSEFERLFKARFATPAEVIDLSRALEIYVGSSVKRAERLQTGERTVEFVSEHTNAKGEKVDIPGIFMVAVPAFLNGEPVRIPARLRYRVANGSIHWSYALYRADVWLRDQVCADLDQVAKQTGLPCYEGAPEA